MFAVISNCSTVYHSCKTEIQGHAAFPLNDVKNINICKPYKTTKPMFI